MKIIHTADLHLESKMESNLDRDKALLRREELLETFERMVHFAADEGVRVILLAGDLFDKPNIRKTAIRLVLDQVIEHPDIDFLYLRGNHDCGDFDSELLSDEAPDNLRLFREDEWTSYSYENVVISGREITESNQKTLSASLILDPSNFNIVMLHGQESDYEGNDKTIKIHLGAFQNKFIDYLALGHIHSYKKERLDDRGEYCYPGCPEGRGFDECGKKGFVVLDIEDGKCTSEFVSLSKRGLHEVEVSVEEDMKSGVLLEEVERSLLAISSQDLVKVVLKGNTQMDQYIDTARIRRTFEERFFFFKVYDKTQVKIHYEQFINDKSLKGTFVRLMQAEDSISEERRADIIEIGIRAIMGEEVDE